MDTPREHSSMQVAVSSALHLGTTIGPASIRWGGSGSATGVLSLYGRAAVARHLGRRAQMIAVVIRGFRQR
jgi:hypothetical protein